MQSLVFSHQTALFIQPTTLVVDGIAAGLVRGDKREHTAAGAEELDIYRYK